MRRSLPIVLAALVMTPLAAIQNAAGQDLAGKTIAIVVPFEAGAVSDPLARVIAPTTPEQYFEALRGQVEKWPPLIERAGITLN